jgi:hypothetical protein
MFHNGVTQWLQGRTIALNVYAFLAAALTYFSMYAFRKPFTAAVYEGEKLLKIDLKILLVTVQVIGYTISKFSGIVIISQLNRKYRGISILGCLLVAELSLVGFGAVPIAVKPLFMFINGLPLGLIWGMVFSFLEGRATSEFLATGMCISFIVASGVVKAVGKAFLDGGMSEYWMPAVTGGVFFPFLVVTTYLLELLPDPSMEDIQSRTERVPMTHKDRMELLKTFGPGVFVNVVFYMTVTAVRDFRDNFAPELWTSFGFTAAPSLFAVSEIIVGFVVIVPIISFVFCIKDNMRTLVAYHILIFCGIGLVGGLALLHTIVQTKVTGMVLMVGSGIGLYLCYVPFSNILWDLILATFEYSANSGFLMYVSDSLGYLSSVVVIMIRNFGGGSVKWGTFFVAVCGAMAVTGVVCMTSSLMYYTIKHRRSMTLHEGLVETSTTI